MAMFNVLNLKSWFINCLQQRELNKRRKASKSDDVEGATEEVVEKPAPVVATSSKRRPESPQAKVAEPPAKKRRGRPPGLTNNKRPGRPQILRVSDGPPKPGDGVEPVEDEKEAARDIHAIAPVKQLQMNMVLGDINSRIASSSVRAEAAPPAKKTLPKKKGRESRKKEIDVADTKEEPISDKVKFRKNSIINYLADYEGFILYTLNEL